LPSATAKTEQSKSRKVSISSSELIKKLTRLKRFKVTATKRIEELENELAQFRTLLNDS
jgi:hypothetical protein